ITVSHEVIKNQDSYRGILNAGPYWSDYDRTLNVGSSSYSSFVAQHPCAIYKEVNNSGGYDLYCPGPITYETGLILQSMAHYLYMSKKVYTQEFNTSFITPVVTFDNTTCNNYNDYSNWIHKLLFEINTSPSTIITTYEYYDKYY